MNETSEKKMHLQLQGMKEEVADDVALPIEQKGDGRRDEIANEHLVVVKRLTMGGVVGRHRPHRRAAVAHHRLAQQPPRLPLHLTIGALPPDHANAAIPGRGLLLAPQLIRLPTTGLALAGRIGIVDSALDNERLEIQIEVQTLGGNPVEAALVGAGLRLDGGGEGAEAAVVRGGGEDPPAMAAAGGGEEGLAASNEDSTVAGIHCGLFLYFICN